MKDYKRGTGQHGNTKHGHCLNGKLSGEYVSYCSMLQRCYYPKHNRWHRYGGRGIRVCERWLGADGFTNFLKDVGFRPTPKHSLDRWPDNDGNYEPGNVRWATTKAQSRERKSKHHVVVGGVEMTLAEACKKYGRDYDKVRARIVQCGWPVAEALEIQP
jgi:hypothetical protein